MLNAYPIVSMHQPRVLGKGDLLYVYFYNLKKKKKKFRFCVVIGAGVGS